MTVVLLVPSFPKLSETFIVSKFANLLRQGWNVHVVCHESEQTEADWFRQLSQGLNVRRRVHVAWPHRPRWRAGLLIPAAIARCLFRNPRGTWRYLRRGWRRFGAGTLRQLYLDAELLCLAPDLIHFEFGSLAPERMYLRELLDCKVIVSFRGYDLNFVGLEDSAYYQDVWDKADALHLLGEDLWRRAQRRGCPPDKPHMLIPPAIDAEFFDLGERQHTEVAGAPARPLRILSTGRLEWKKGYDYALQAAQMLKEQKMHIEYRIIGDGEYLGAVAFARYQLGLKEDVELLGAQPRSRVRAEMLWADVFLHAATSEGFCNAVMEAQAMALPVVCTDADGLAENVSNGETGFVVPRRDPQALADKLIRLAHDPSRRQQMGAAGYRRVRTQFRLEKQIASFDLLYRRVLSPGEKELEAVTLPHS